MTLRPRLLIEEWLPMAELGIESRREAAPIPGQFPKLKTLHVWWARRPLAASAGAVLSSLLPAWSSDLATAFPSNQELASIEHYQSWFLRLCGILGDPVAAKAEAQRNAELGTRSAANPFTYKQAFKNSPTSPISSFSTQSSHVPGAQCRPPAIPRRAAARSRLPVRGLVST